MYLYHAEALGLGGQISRPFNAVLESQAATSLPMSGGYGKASSEKFSYQQIISFDAAYTEVIGNCVADQDTYTTQVSVTVENLNVMGVVTADKVVGRVSSTHVISQNKDEASIVPVGCYFQNLRIAGNPADPQFDFDAFTRFSTFNEFKKAYEGPERDALRQRMMWNHLKAGCPPPLNSMHSWYQEQKSTPSVLFCSLVKDLGFKQKAGIDPYGAIVVVPNFGIIYVCEFVIVHRQRRLNMLRVEMGASSTGSFRGGTWNAQSAKTAPVAGAPPVSGGSTSTIGALDGELSIGSVSANGSTYPPPGGG